MVVKSVLYKNMKNFNHPKELVRGIGVSKLIKTKTCDKILLNIFDKKYNIHKNDIIKNCNGINSPLGKDNFTNRLLFGIFIDYFVKYSIHSIDSKFQDGKASKIVFDMKLETLKYLTEKYETSISTETILNEEKFKDWLLQNNIPSPTGDINYPYILPKYIKIKDSGHRTHITRLLNMCKTSFEKVVKDVELVDVFMTSLFHLTFFKHYDILLQLDVREIMMKINNIISFLIDLNKHMGHRKDNSLNVICNFITPENSPVKGECDLIIDDELIDIKTSKSNYGNRLTHFYQLFLYAALYKEYTGIKINKLSIMNVSNNTYYSIDISDWESEEEILEKINENF